MEKIILGTVQFGVNYGINNSLGKPSEESVFNILDYAQKIGLNTLDTAEDYGNAQKLIGRFHSTHLRRFEIISKLTHNHRLNEPLLEHVKQTLAVMNVDELYLYMFHNYNMFRSSSFLLEEFVHLKVEGLVRKVGVSVYTNEEFQHAIDNDWIDVIQLPFNLLDNSFQKGHLLKLAKSRGKEIHVRSVFLQGLFFMEKQKLPTNLLALQPYIQHIQSLESKLHVSLESLSLQYVYHNPYVDKILIGVESIEQLARNITGILISVNKDLFEEIDNIKVKETWLLNPVNWK